MVVPTRGADAGDYASAIFATDAVADGRSDSVVEGGSGYGDHVDSCPCVDGAFSFSLEDLLRLLLSFFKLLIYVIQLSFDNRACSDRECCEPITQIPEGRLSLCVN